MSQSAEERTAKCADKIVNVFNTGSNQEISELFRYPVGTCFPCPVIETKVEFLTKMDFILDDGLRAIIKNSNPIKDWKPVGWRGSMLNNGIVWIDDYTCLIIGLNYHTKRGIMCSDSIIENDKRKLHPSLREFKSPELKAKTKKFIFRIDNLENNEIRYASWSINKSMDSKPEIILRNGKYVQDGTGGNHKYVFKNKEYTYEVFVSVMSEEEWEVGSLSVLKGEEVIYTDSFDYLDN